MPFAVTLVPGDGTGPEITEATRRVLEATGVRFEWQVRQAGAEMLEKYGTVLPDDAIESIKQTKVALKGPITTPIGKGSRRANVTLRKKLDLYANLRPAKTYPGLRSRYDKIDLVIVRENTEDLYAGIEFQRGTAEYEEIIEAIKQLTPVYRTVFNLFAIEGMTHEEIATQLQISVGASKSNLSKARHNLRKIISHQTQYNTYVQTR